MKQAMKEIREFQVANELPVDLTFVGPTSQRAGELIADTATELAASAREFMSAACDIENPVSDRTLFIRLHLIAEEVGEVFEAAKDGDRKLLLDALADSCYVVIGTAVAYGLPLAAAFAEVHASNMTKERQATDAHGQRLSGKGPYYIAPDLEGVLAGRRTLLGAIQRLANEANLTVLDVVKLPRPLPTALGMFSVPDDWKILTNHFNKEAE